MPRSDRVTAVAQRYTDARQFAGIEWLVERKGEVLTRGRSGTPDCASDAEFFSRPLYRIYSMTKPIVSALGLILVEQGKLRLYDVLPQFNSAFANMRVLLPNGRVEPAQRPITVEDLFTHRAGFTYEFITGCHIAQYYRAVDLSSNGARSLDETMRVLADQPLAFQPGSQYRYSVATDALAHVIEKAADMPIDQLLKQELLDPLGMADTSYCVPADQRPRIMPMHGVADITALPSLTMQPHTLERIDVDAMYPADDPNFRRGGHGLFSTMDDYAQFARMLINGQTTDGRTLLSRPMLKMMCTNRIPAEQLPLTIGMNPLPGYGWGLGVRVMMDVGKSLALTNVGELGWAGAASTYFWTDPAEEMIGLIMTQYLGAALPLADDMRTAAYQMLK